ncbi:MAG: flagellar basal body L-ring protein FlgH [Opitutae bacterium]|nr:flagellar basal body L-ring protein FlgH [Opitutae bacterium]
MLPARSLFLPLALAAAPALRAESLWTAAGHVPERSMFADRKAGAVGDILTVVVQETAASSSSQRKKSDRASSVDASVSQFLFPLAASLGGSKGGALPATTFSAKNDFSGGGDVSNAQSLTATTAVLVTDVLPNGNLVIQGVRLVTFSGETQYVVLHGIVRPDDISAGNNVFSSSIADARVEFVSMGSLTDAQKKGWLTKLYDLLRPY